MSSRQIKSCLVVSYGPVPTPQYQTIEGGGMRAWGLAKGLQEQGVEVTVAVNNSFPQELEECEGIKLTNWSPDEAFRGLLGAFDAIIASYCMGSDSVFIADNTPSDTQLILDLYVPIYVEVSARDSEDIDTEYRNYMADIQHFNHVLRRGDYFLCASQVQKIFYTGVLGSLGVVNPRSYREGRILVVPFGIHDLPVISERDPYREELGIAKKDFVVLWFGGLYPWFRVDELMDSIKSLSSEKNIKFVIVGGKNPFNSNPNFVKQYTFAHDYATKHKLLDKSLFFVEWVDFDDRINWFTNADLIISINNPGEENSFSWRTRVMDFVWGETAILTNGEDVLSEELLAKNAAVRLPSLSSQSISETIKHLAKNPSELTKLKKNLHAVKEDYFWHQVVKPAMEVIASGKRPNIDERAYSDRILPKSAVEQRWNKLESYTTLVRKALYHTKEGGVYHTARLVKHKLQPRLSGSRPRSRPRQYVFISHPIDNTGAPLVLMQMIEETAAKHGAQNVTVIAPHIDPQHLRSLRSSGVKVERAVADAEPQVIRLQTSLRKDDFLLMNTLAVPPNYQNYFLELLEDNRLKRAFWYIHEDASQIGPMKATIGDHEYARRVSRLLKKKRLTMLVPSDKVRKDYTALFGSQDIQTVPYRIDVPEQYKKPRLGKNFDRLDFLLTGSATDGRKGQFIAISAFYTFIKDYYEKNPEKYRNFRLHLVAIGNDFVSQQIRSLSDSLLGKKHAQLYPPVSRDEALKISHNCNAVICCSLNETFAIYVAEGMFMGHVVLRNHSAGQKEQLQEGVNGFAVNETDIQQFAKVIEKLLNKQKTSNQKLLKMGLASQKIIAPYAQHTYLDKIEPQGS
jgi:glycosyltransferase involved in cell wall biosynthesis